MILVSVGVLYSNPVAVSVNRLTLGKAPNSPSTKIISPLLVHGYGSKTGDHPTQDRGNSSSESYVGKLTLWRVIGETIVGRVVAGVVTLVDGPLK